MKLTSVFSRLNHRLKLMTTKPRPAPPSAGNENVRGETAELSRLARTVSHAPRKPPGITALPPLRQSTLPTHVESHTCAAPPPASSPCLASPSSPAPSPLEEFGLSSHLNLGALLRSVVRLNSRARDNRWRARFKRSGRNPSPALFHEGRDAHCQCHASHSPPTTLCHRCS